MTVQRESPITPFAARPVWTSTDGSALPDSFTVDKNQFPASFQRSPNVPSARDAIETCIILVLVLSGAVTGTRFDHVLPPSSDVASMSWHSSPTISRYTTNNRSCSWL